VVGHDRDHPVLRHAGRQQAGGDLAELPAEIRQAPSRPGSRALGRYSLILMGLEFSRQLIARCGIILLAVAAGQTRKAR